MKKAFLFVFLLMNVGLFAGNPSSVMFINGTVTDQQTNETLAGVEVSVKGTDIVTYTDFDGHFFLPDLPSGSYELRFRYITYETTQQVTDNCDHCTSLSVTLSQR